MRKYASNAERQRAYRRRKAEAKAVSERELLREAGVNIPDDWLPHARYWALKGNIAKKLIAEERARRRNEHARSP